MIPGCAWQDVARVGSRLRACFELLVVIRVGESLFNKLLIYRQDRVPTPIMETQPYTTDIATASDDSEPRSDSKHPKGLAFWLTIGCICSSLFLSALELVSSICP